MKPVYCIAANTTCPLGLDLAETRDAMNAGRSAIQCVNDPALLAREAWVSRMPGASWDIISSQVDAMLSPFEQMAVFSANGALKACPTRPNPEKTLLVIASTKGNIEWLGQQQDERNSLHYSAGLISQALGISNKPVVISQACVSGVSALIYGLRSLQNGRFENAIVVGADRLTGFVLSGFESFKALAHDYCRPFDAARKGINLGEAAAAIVLSMHPGTAPLARLMGGATSNDANHISSPSRTGAELANAIAGAMAEAGLASSDIDVISAHGTATIYNDEMEAKAFALSGLLKPPAHSVKGYLGHTLGAAGVLESALLIDSMRRGQTIASLGYERSGVSEPINVLNESIGLDMRYALKTASGFGGCNAALVWGGGGGGVIGS